MQLTRLEDRHDARMGERRGQPWLHEEAGSETLALGQLRRDQLQGDGPLEREVDRPVDNAHAPTRDKRFDAVTAERRPRGDGDRHAAASASDSI
jgi:hypothetical protein